MVQTFQRGGQGCPKMHVQLKVSKSVLSILGQSLGRGRNKRARIHRHVQALEARGRGLSTQS